MMRPYDSSMINSPATWAATDPIIPYGIQAINSDGSGFKIGDGINTWSNLPYAGSTAIGTKLIQTSRDPLNNELLEFCSSTDRWVFRLRGCLDTVTNWESSSTTFPTYSMLIETSDSTLKPTGRFKIADGATPFNELPWFGVDFATESWSAGESIEFNGTYFEPATYIKSTELQSATTPVGKFHRDDGTWALISDDYVTGPASSTNNNIAVFDGITGKVVKDSGVDVTTLPSDEGTPNTTFQVDIGSGPILKNISGTLHIYDPTDTELTTITAQSTFASFGNFDTIYIGWPTETDSVTLTSDGTDLFIDGHKVWNQNNDGHGSGLDADTLDGYHATDFATGPITAVENNIVTFGSSPSILIDSGYMPASFAPSTHTQSASTIELLELGTSTYDDLQDWINATQSAGRITGGVLSAHSPADGTLDISALKGFIKVADSDIAETRFFDFASTTISLTDDNTNYIYIDYNSGSPTAYATTDRSSINHTTHFTLGRAFRSGNDVQVLQSGINLYNRTRLTHEKWIDTFGGISYANGLLVTCTGLKPAVSAGILYAGSNKLSLDALDCNASDTFTAYYTTDSGVTWTTQTDQTNLNATQYNNITTGLATLNNNQYGVHWLYICPDGCLAILYGQESYTLTAAQALTTPPTIIPNVLNEWTKLAAKIIIAKGEASVYSITHAWSTAFPVQSPGDHNSLAGLQGGTSSEYYHLTATEYNTTVPRYYGELASVPATYKSGDEYYNTGDSKFYKYNGTDWIALN